MKKIPGPLAPPLTRRPSRKITALSYSCTTLTHIYKEKGSLARTRSSDKNAIKRAQRPGPPTSPFSANSTLSLTAAQHSVKPSLTSLLRFLPRSFFLSSSMLSSVPSSLNDDGDDENDG